MHQNQIFRRFNGLTLIEFMIVLAVAGILIATIVPQLQNALVRSRVVEGLSSAAELKALVSQNAAQGASNLGQGAKPMAQTRLVKSMTVTNTTTGEIEVRFGEQAGGATLVLVPYVGSAAAPTSLAAGVPVAANTVVQWQCKANASRFPLGSSGTTLAAHAPDSCQ
jgi:type IV pilus assembly protein PilA